MVKIRELVFLLLVLVYLQLGTLEASIRHLRHVLEDNAIPGRLENEHRILIECQNSDYRTYIKCLKREKRQHQHLDGCLDECFNKECTNSTCLRDCHANCKSRRLIETYIKTVETNLGCQNSSCSGNNGNGNGGTPNITTNIHIENILPNDTSRIHSQTNPGGTPINDTSPYVIPKIDINNVINNQFGPPGPGGPYQGSGWNNGYNNYLQNYQPLPQITIGFGGGPVGGGCMFPWPCSPKNSNVLDCSPCSNPFLRYQCDVRCYPDPQYNKNNTQINAIQNKSPSQPGTRSFTSNNRYP